MGRLSTNLAVTVLCLLLLVPGTSSGQSYSPMYEPGSKFAVWWHCENQYGQWVACDLTLTTISYQGNAHTWAYHSTPRPHSYIAFNSGGPFYATRQIQLAADQEVPVWVKAGMRVQGYDWNFDVRLAVGQPEYLQGCPAGGVCAAWDYAVGYQDIYWTEEKPEYIHVGARPEHGNSNSYNHWMMSHAAYGIWDAVKDFIARHPSQVKAALNDMALPFGGLFDISGNWQPDHWGHFRGTSVDVRGSTAQYAIPDGQQAEFLTDCRNRGAHFYRIEDRGTPNQHIHCQWTY